MKASTALKKATELQNRINALLDPIEAKLVEILGEDTVHLVYQSGDGWCICHNGADNAAVSFFDIDELLAMGRDDCIEALERAGI